MFKATIFGLIGCITVAIANAGPYPDKVIRLIVPAAAGGSTDMGARAVAKAVGAEIGQVLVVDNKGGGGGRIGAAEAARSTGDGYTLIYGNAITHALLPGAAKALTYDAIKDFIPIGGVFWYSTLIVCNANRPYNDLASMIAWAKKNPGKMTIATAGPGSGNHFSSLLLASMANIDVVHIPYKGNAPATQDVIAGTVDCIHISEAKPYLDSGRLKAIATTGIKRDPRFPSIPTVDESGLKGYDVTWWQAVFAPKNTPPLVVEKLAAATKKATESPEVKASMAEAGFVPQFVPGPQLTDRMKVETAKYRSIAVNAKLDIE